MSPYLLRHSKATFDIINIIIGFSFTDEKEAKSQLLVTVISNTFHLPKQLIYESFLITEDVIVHFVLLLVKFSQPTTIFCRSNVHLGSIRQFKLK